MNPNIAIDRTGEDVSPRTLRDFCSGKGPKPCEADHEYLLRLYRRDIGRYPLIGPDREVELAKRIEAGDEMASFELTVSNLRLALDIAANDFDDGSGLPLLDRIEEGNIGLMTAVERFDWRKGNRFSTYATDWIRASIQEAIYETSRTIRLSEPLTKRLGRIGRFVSDFQGSHGRAPSEGEIAAEFGLSPVQMRHLRDVPWRPQSLDLFEGRMDNGNDIRNESDQTPYERLESAELRRGIDAALKRLHLEDERFIPVLRLRLGFNSEDRVWEFAEIAEKFGITRARVGQLYRKAIQAIRAMLVEAELAD